VTKKKLKTRAEMVHFLYGRGMSCEELVVMTDLEIKDGYEFALEMDKKDRRAK
jgi:hypothetical protein